MARRGAGDAAGDHGGRAGPGAPPCDARLHVGTITAVLDLAPDPIVVLDERMRVVTSNRRAVEFFGRDPGSYGVEPPLDLVHPDDLPLALSSFEEILTKDVGTPIELRLRVADGTWRYCEVVGSTHHHAGGIWQINAVRDLTERRRFQVAARETERFRSVVESAAVVMLLLDGAGVVESVSGGMCRQLGHDPVRVVGSRFEDWVVREERDAVVGQLAAASCRPGVTTLECSLRHKDGRTIPYQFSVTNLLDDPLVAGLVLSGHDISARRDLEARLAHLANHDDLTGVANRARLVEFLDACCASDDAERLAVLLIDLDRFKPVNDLYGHDAGDRLLVALARRLVGSVRPGDLVARLGGDEFVVVVPNCDATTVPVLVERTEEVLAAPVTIGRIRLQVHASIGVVTGRRGCSAERLLAEADEAMYRVKRSRRGEVVNLGPGPRRELVDDLAAAVEVGPEALGFVVHYQPIVRLADGRRVGAEALLRWNHPKHGWLAPPAFFPVAEDAGLDVALGAWVLRSALGQLASWDALADGTIAGTGDRAPFTMAVNLSSSQVSDPELESVVVTTLADLGLAPRRLCLEVTEQLVLGRATRRRRPTSAALHALAARGVLLAIDDFGTGFSNLHHLREYPAHILKIDSTFVADLAGDPTSAGICAAVVALARATGKTIVAEGVETLEQAVALTQLGVEHAQGHHFGPAVCADDFPVAVLATVP